MPRPVTFAMASGSMAYPPRWEDSIATNLEQRAVWRANGPPNGATPRPHNPLATIPAAPPSLWQDDVERITQGMVRGASALFHQVVGRLDGPHLLPLSRAIGTFVGLCAGLTARFDPEHWAPAWRGAPSQPSGAHPAQTLAYQLLPTLPARACGTEPECGICFEPLSALPEPVAACHGGVVQVFNHGHLKMYWAAFPDRGYTTPNRMPISALYKIVGEKAGTGPSVRP